MDQHGDLPLAQAHDARRVLVEDPVDDLDLEEVVARAERAALVVAPGDGLVTDPVGVGAVEPAVRLGEPQVALRPPALLDDVGRALLHQPLQLRLVEQVLAALADAGWDVAEELIDEWPDPGLGVLPVEFRPQEPDAAIDVVADSPGRDDAPRLGVGRGHPADGEAVAPVDVGHRQAGLLNARQGRDVGHLLRTLVLLDLLDQHLVREDQAIDPHVRAVALRDPPLARPDLFQGARVSAGAGHRFSPRPKRRSALRQQSPGRAQNAPDQTPPPDLQTRSPCRWFTSPRSSRDDRVRSASRHASPSHREIHPSV